VSPAEWIKVVQGVGDGDGARALRERPTLKVLGFTEAVLGAETEV